MTVRVPYRTAAVYSGSTWVADLALTDGILTIDDGWAPRVQASIVIARPSLAVLAALDPTIRTSRVRLVLRADADESSLFLDLKITARQMNAADATVSLNLQSDEALLQDFGLVSSGPDKTFWAYQSSVHSIVFNVLNRALGVGNFSLAISATVPTPWPSFPTYSRVENLIPNGSFDNGSPLPWVGLGAVVTASTGFRLTGQYSLLVNPNSTSNDSAAEVTEIRVMPGKTYTVSGFIGRAGVQPGTLNARARRIWIYTYIDGQVVVIGQSPQAPNIAATSRQAVTFTVPANAESVNVRLYSGAASGTSAGVYWENVMMVEGDGLDTNATSVMPFFDGATADSSTYTYDWTGDTNNSSSTRTPVLDRGPDALTWSPGQTAWDFLTPILQAVGWRLAPRQFGRGWIVTSVDDLDPGSPLAISVGQNLYALSDLVSRTASQSDGTPLFAEAVLIHYTWTDSASGERREQWESAGPTTAQKVHTIERPDVAYPGPGTAAYVLDRLASRRRQLTVDAAEDYVALPGREVSITGPGGDVVTGVVDALTWDFASARMTVKTKGLVTIPSGALGRAPTTQTIGSVTTATLASYTN
jgi:hypothetical protein